MTKPKAEKQKAGRKTAYEKSVHPRWAASLARRGCTVDEIAEEFGVARSTLYRWRDLHAEFSDALNESRSQADEAVVDSLYARATGRARRTTKRKREVLDGDGRKVTLTEMIEETPAPDTTAMIYWLKNRQPALWRDQPREDASASSDKAIKEAIAKAGLR